MAEWRYDHEAGTVWEGEGRSRPICYLAGRHHGDPSVGERIAAAGRVAEESVEKINRALQITAAAERLSACAAEFDGDLRPCGEYLDALWSAVDGKETA